MRSRIVMPIAAQIVSSDAAFGPLLYLSLFFGTFLHEGTAIAAGAAVFVTQHTSAPLTAAALVAGIVTGDMSVYGLGALARRNKWLQRKLGVSAPLHTQPLINNRLIRIVAMCRVVPGILYPTFLSYGWRGVPFLRFAITSISVTLLYVTILLTLFVQFSVQLAEILQHWPAIPFIAIGTAGVVLVVRWFWPRQRRSHPTRQHPVLVD